MPSKNLSLIECLFYSVYKKEDGSMGFIYVLGNLVKLEMSINLSQCNVDWVT